ncbi:amyloid fiber anchoring/assembly protein TapA [Virgibacillus kimchii]
MRSKRLRKFRRQFPVAFFLVKLVLIWYLVVFSISYLTSGTAAHFYDAEEADAKVHAGFWADGWDGSSLSFMENGNTNIKSCDPVEISTEIKNTGDGDMVDGSVYDIYYIENGNPEKHGVKLDLPEDEGSIPALEPGQSTELTHIAQQPGVYAFLAEQPEGHPEGDTVWSKWVIVNCPSGKAEVDAETETEEEAEPENEADPETEKEERPEQDADESVNEESEAKESEEKNENSKEHEEEIIEEEIEDEETEEAEEEGEES